MDLTKVNNQIKMSIAFGYPKILKKLPRKLFAIGYFKFNKKLEQMLEEQMLDDSSSSFAERRISLTSILKPESVAHVNRKGFHPKENLQKRFSLRF